MRFLLVLFPRFLVASSGVPQLTDDLVKHQIIAESIASYPGRCPCPHNPAKNGRECGGRSAWISAGGHLHGDVGTAGRSGSKLDQLCGSLTLQTTEL